ncbi:hypothetical protein [Streptomyces hydrogenans]|uniref:hypothetical protein n=1 Tax=Streptomyces hydrogenans TaxID=1873719 RepID=UPI0035DD35FD
MILTSPLRRRGPEIRKARDDRTAHHRMGVADGRAPHGGPRSDATLCAHTDDGTLGNARELHAEQQARRSA